MSIVKYLPQELNNQIIEYMSVRPRNTLDKDDPYVDYSFINKLEKKYWTIKDISKLERQMNYYLKNIKMRKKDIIENKKYIKPVTDYDNEQDNYYISLENDSYKKEIELFKHCIRVIFSILNRLFHIRKISTIGCNK